MEHNFEAEPHSQSSFDYRIGSLLVILILILAYIFFAIDQVEAESKTVSVNVNGLATQHITGHATVGDLVSELYPDGEQINAIFPDRESKLTPGATIFIEMAPAINPTVAANLAQAQKDAEEEAVEETAPPPPPAPKNVEPKSPVYTATASWYRWGDRMTTASTQFPRGTTLRVIAINSGKSVDVVVNDYGPEPWTGVMLDLNSVAFAQLAPLGAGKIPVRYYVI